MDNNFLIPLPRAFTVLVAPAGAGGIVPSLLTELALRGPMNVLDGGNHFPVYRLIQLLRLRLPDPMPVAGRVTIRRAFTCHQMTALLEATPAHHQPTVLLDPLSSFYDENVPLYEARHLLETCLRHVNRLRQAAGVLAVIIPPDIPERLPLFDRFCSAGGSLLTLEPAPLLALQPALF
jgi:hypothetical protein